jgi:uncharacterized lipoprotein YajG
MKALGVLIAILLLAGCAPRWGGRDNTNWGALSQQVGKQINR